MHVLLQGPFQNDERASRSSTKVTPNQLSSGLTMAVTRVLVPTCSGRAEKHQGRVWFSSQEMQLHLCVQKTAFVWLAVYIETGQHET